MNKEQIQLLIHNREYTKFDLKAELRCHTKPEKAEIIKDIIAIVNPPGVSGHLIYGVNDDGTPSGKLDLTITEEQIQQIIKEYCEPYIETRYEIVEYNNVPVGCLSIFREAYKLPYRVRKTVGGAGSQISKDDVFYRYGRHATKIALSDLESLFEEQKKAATQPKIDISDLIKSAAINTPQTSRITSIPYGGGALDLPCFFPSISSVKTHLRLRDYLDILINLRHPQFLISAYDIHNCLHNLPKQSKITKEKEQEYIANKLNEAIENRQAVILDSGNYESYWHKDNTWKKEKFHKYLKKTDYHFAFSWDKRGQTVGKRDVKLIINEVEKSVLVSSNVSTGTVLPIVHAKKEDLPEITSGVVKRLVPIMIAVPERELGDGILERAKTLQLIRNQLNQLGQYVPIHLLGTGNPLAILIYVICGADSFDGLEWCQTTADFTTGQLYHFQQRDFFRKQSSYHDDESLSYTSATLAHNLEFYMEWMIRIQKHLANDTIGQMANKYLTKSLIAKINEMLPGSIA